MKNYKQNLVSYRLSVAIRCFIAIIGSYTLAAISNVFLALHLPLTPSEAVISANMLCLLIFCLAVCTVFAVHQHWQAFLVILIPSLILGLLNHFGL